MKVDYQLFALAPSPQINGDHFVILHLNSVMFVADGHFLVLRPCLNPLTDLSFQLPDRGSFNIDVVKSQGQMATENHWPEIFHNDSHSF